MTQAKFRAFINAAIQKTKSGGLSWERVNMQQFRQGMWPDYDLSRSFICHYATGRMLLVYDVNSDLPCCLIAPDKGLPFQKVAVHEDDCALLLRLYNLVYDSFPSIESFMDAMINSNDDQEDPPF